MWKYLFGFLAFFFFYQLNNHFNICALNVFQPSDEGSFRVMTYNTNGIHWIFDDSEFETSFLNALDSIHPQLLVLQELRTNYSESVCSELKNRYPYNSLVELSKLKNGDKNAACLFSLYPIKSFFRFSYDKQEIDSVYRVTSVPDSVWRPNNAEIYNAVLEIDNQDTFVLCCYLKTNNFSKLLSEHSDSWHNEIEDFLKGYNLGSSVRFLNAKMIRDSIAKYDLPTIICGDMNDFQFSSAVKTMMSNDLKNVWWERGFGYGMTYDKYHLKIRIDHILISKDIEAVRVDVPHLPFSDHYPIVADLKFVNE